MKIIRRFFVGIARFFISLIFLSGALNKILHWHESEKTLHSVLCEWQSDLGFSEMAHECFGLFVPLTPLLLLLACLMELIGGLLVLLGIKEKLGAALLVLFLIPATVIMHQFWFVEGPMREQQLAHFLKNLAILGGLLILMLRGAEQSQPKSPFPRNFSG